MKREYRGLSKRTQRLLAMPEGIDVDFKRDVTGVHGSDLVAFANSLRGGTLLIGIDEYTTEDGVQRGQICGCDVDDNDDENDRDPDDKDGEDVDVDDYDDGDEYVMLMMMMMMMMIMTSIVIADLPPRMIPVLSRNEQLQRQQIVVGTFVAVSATVKRLGHLHDVHYTNVVR